MVWMKLAGAQNLAMGPAQRIEPFAEVHLTNGTAAFHINDHIVTIPREIITRMEHAVAAIKDLREQKDRLHEERDAAAAALVLDGNDLDNLKRYHRADVALQRHPFYRACSDYETAYCQAYAAVSKQIPQR